MKALATPTQLQLGGLALVLPDRERPPTPRLWSDISCAVIWEAEGADGPARALIAELEARLGVRPAHRQACAGSAAEVHKVIASTAQRKATAQVQRAARLAGAIRPPAPTDEIERLMKRAGAAERKAEELRKKNARAHSTAIREHRTEARRCRIRAGRLREEQLDAHWAGQAIGETADYALARGEDVIEEVAVRARFETDEDGARLRHRRDARPAGLKFPGHRRGDAVLVEEQVVRRRVLTRGGLKLAHERGDLDEGKGAKRERLLFATGQHYQACYERLPGMGAASGAGEPGSRGSAGPEQPIGQEIATDRRRDLGVMRAKLDPRQRTTLDHVCGLDMTVAHSARVQGAGIPATRRALREGLWNAAEALRKAPGPGAARGQT